MKSESDVCADAGVNYYLLLKLDGMCNIPMGTFAKVFTAGWLAHKAYLSKRKKNNRKIY